MSAKEGQISEAKNILEKVRNALAGPLTSLGGIVKERRQAISPWLKGVIKMNYRRCLRCGKEVGIPGTVVWCRDTETGTEMIHETCAGEDGPS